MENPHIDIERMIMQSQYKQTLNSVSANTASNMSDMERKDYEDKISELFKAVKTLLDHNNSMGRQLEEAKTSLQEANVTISKANDEIEALKAKISKLEGENAMRRRKTYGRVRKVLLLVIQTKVRQKMSVNLTSLRMAARLLLMMRRTMKKMMKQVNLLHSQSTPSVTRPTVLIITKRCMQMSV